MTKTDRVKCSMQKQNDAEVYFFLCCHAFRNAGINACRNHNNRIRSEQGFAFLTKHLACFRRQP